MESFAQAVPVQPGKTQALRGYAAQLTGPRFSEEQAFHKRAGTRREATWLQQTPHGDLFVFYWEGEDADRFKAELEQFLKAEDGHGAWVREQFIDLFGIDPSAGLPPLPEPLWDYVDPEAGGGGTTKSFALAVPVQPGKTQALRDYVAQLAGPKYDEEKAFHQRVGTRREASWLQQTPGGDLFVTYCESEDADRFKAELEQFFKAEDGHGAWVREQFIDLFGIDPSVGLPPLPEPLWDYVDLEAGGGER